MRLPSDKDGLMTVARARRKAECADELSGSFGFHGATRSRIWPAFDSFKNEASPATTRTVLGIRSGFSTVLPGGVNPRGDRRTENPPVVVATADSRRATYCE